VVTVDHFDAVVVGSGFGGSVTTARLAEAGKSVCLLERGKAYPPGSFPRSPREVAQNFWDPSERQHGMFDVWSFSHMEAIVSSGLGGGSLIYANVELRKDENWFVDETQPVGQQQWPVSRAQLDPHYEEVEARIGIQTYPLDHEPFTKTSKAHAFRDAAAAVGLDWDLVPLAVTFGNPHVPPVPGEQIVETRPNYHGMPRTTCQLVGECDLGCNFGSKNSMDHTYISDAKAAGADIRVLCEVTTMRPRDGESRNGFVVEYRQHVPGASSTEAAVHEVTCDRLVLSAGTLGTTYLLLRNAHHFPGISPRLGDRFSGNGDFLGLVLRARKPAEEGGGPRFLHASTGPVITSAVRLPDDVDGVDGAHCRGGYIQDAGYPQLVNWGLEQALPGGALRLLTFLTRRGIGRAFGKPRPSVGFALSRALGQNITSSTSMPLLGMGRDIPDGKFRLRGTDLDLEWHPRASGPYYDRMNSTMKQLAQAMGGHYGTSLLWKLNLLATVHPLGGCPMGTDRNTGVVDSFGQVFGVPGLLIADGSVMPGPVGPNPSLTIAALADRFATHLLEEWGPR
jgi:cholesterol oxidase